MSSTSFLERADLMPSLFVGHGSPMNLVASNEFTKALNRLGKLIRPQGILVISAHWMDKVLQIQNDKNQKIIYDFYGFPEELYQMNYAAVGWDDQLLQTLKNMGMEERIQYTDRRGLDHGTWAVLYHMYPGAEIPIVQMSMPQNYCLEDHYNLGRKLKSLRERGILILGSGNIVHNLRQIDWSPQAPSMEWAVEFDQLVADRVSLHDYEKLISIDKDHRELFNLAHPTAEHYYPLAYVLGSAEESSQVSFPCDFIQNGSISMRSILFE